MSWELLAYLPKLELKRIKQVFVEQYYKSELVQGENDKD